MNVFGSAPSLPASFRVYVTMIYTPTKTTTVSGEILSPLAPREDLRTLTPSSFALLYYHTKLDQPTIHPSIHPSTYPMHGIKQTKPLIPYRWVTCGDSGLRIFSDLVVAHQLALPQHLRSWSDAARLCAMEADRQYPPPPEDSSNNAQGNPGNVGGMAAGGGNGSTTMANAFAGGGGYQRNGAGGAGTRAAEGQVVPPAAATGKRQKLRHRKKHCLPRSGLAGMLKFLGAPKDAARREDTLHGLTRRGMETVAGVAQCVACLVRIGVPFPVTGRMTQLWGPGGTYEGTQYDELPLILLPAAPASGSAGGASAVGGGGGQGRGQGQGQGQVWGASPQQQQQHQAQTRVAPASTTMSENNHRDINNRGGVVPEKKKKTSKKNGPGGAGGGGGGGGGAPGGHGGGGALVSHAGSRGAVESVPRGGGAMVGGGGAIPEWRKNTPVSSLSPDYLDYFLRDRERQFYKSAGILPYR